MICSPAFHHNVKYVISSVELVQQPSIRDVMGMGLPVGMGQTYSTSCERLEKENNVLAWDEKKVYSHVI